MNQRVLCIWLPNWPSQRAAVAASRSESPYPAKPRVLYANDSRRGRVVAAANAMARKAGVLPGLPLAQLASICPDAQWEEHDAQADIEELMSLADALHSFSPVVGLEDLDAQAWAGRYLNQPQSISMEIGGTASWFGGEEAMGAAVQRWLAHRGYVACIGIGDSLGAAWGIANYAFRDRIASAMEALETTGECAEAPSWVAGFPDDATGLSFFGDYPIEMLRLDPDCVAKLHRLGIRTMAPLLRLPRSSLTSRFGAQLLRRIDQCLGGITEPLRTFHAGAPLVAERAWEHPISDWSHVEDAVERACIDLCRTLRECGHGALRLVCQWMLEQPSIDLHPRDASGAQRVHVMQLSLYQACQDPAHLAWLLNGQLQAQPPRLGAETGIRGLRLEATVSAPVRWRQNDLFSDVGLEHRDAAAKLIDVLSARLGRKRVVAARIVRDPIPEAQVRMRPLTGLRNDGSQQQTERKLPRAPKRNFAQEPSLETPDTAFLSRPCELIEPIAVEVQVAAWGEPTSIGIHRQQWRIVASAGPERIESGWWSGPTLRREYYRVALESGDWWWIYRDMRSMTWHLHGAFA